MRRLLSCEFKSRSGYPTFISRYPYPLAGNGYISVASKKSQAVLKNRAKKREIMYALMTPCERCGDFDVAFMDWHHTDPSQKEDSVAQLLRNRGLIALLQETEKCICLCSNCHRKLHYYEHP